MNKKQKSVIKKEMTKKNKPYKPTKATQTLGSRG